MKTPEMIQERITKLQNDGLSAVDPKERKKLANELAFLNDCKRYLEHNPSEDFLKETLAKLEKQMKGLNEKFHHWIIATPNARNLKNPKTAYASEVGLKSMRAQAETLRFILT